MVRSRITVTLDFDSAVLNMDGIQNPLLNNLWLGCVNIKCSKPYRTTWHKRHAKLSDGKLSFYKFKTDVIWDLAPVKTIYASKVFGITFHSVKGKSTPKNCVMPWNCVQLDFCYNRKKIMHVRFPKLETVNLWMSVFAGGTKKVISKPERKEIKFSRAYFKTYTVKRNWQHGDIESIELKSTNGTTKKVSEQTASQTREDKFLGKKLQQCAVTQGTGLVRGTLSPHKPREASTDVPTTLANTIMTEVTVHGCNKETSADSSLERDLAALCSIENTEDIGKVETLTKIEQDSQTRQPEQTTLESQDTLNTRCDGRMVESERSFRNGEKFFVKANGITSLPENCCCNTLNEEQKCDCRPCHSEPCAIAHPPFAKLRDRVGTLLFQHGCYASVLSTPVSNKQTTMTQEITWPTKTCGGANKFENYAHHL
ncbi:Dynein heavy chain [Trichuris trichiura]|uniref:Dynein heavy chain n=1 Tax=Trichuris trichiura TaxID=36087 RepID=A0A077Z6H0_TRITR|nr:Dynein heavy chain [Trichuris trichiura]